MYITIQEFSKRTGLSPSKLRFYDKKGLLNPSARLENGYRAYTADQISLAKIIDSLRLADIPISEIKRYSQANEQQKKMMLDHWKKDLDKRMEALAAARKYVGSIKTDHTQPLLLSKWEKEKRIVWQRFEAKRNPHPFLSYFILAKQRIKEYEGEVSEQVYVRTEQLAPDKIIGEIGFEVGAQFLLEETENIWLELIPPTLFAVLQNCRADDAFLCFSYIQVVIRYGFQPAQVNKIERYADTEAVTFDYLIPLVN